MLGLKSFDGFLSQLAVVAGDQPFRIDGLVGREHLLKGFDLEGAGTERESFGDGLGWGG